MMSVQTAGTKNTNASSTAIETPTSATFVARLTLMNAHSAGFTPAYQNGLAVLVGLDERSGKPVVIEG
jgi:hypothetical protein